MITMNAYCVILLVFLWRWYFYRHKQTSVLTGKIHCSVKLNETPTMPQPTLTIDSKHSKYFSSAFTYGTVTAVLSIHPTPTHSQLRRMLRKSVYIRFYGQISLIIYYKHLCHLDHYWLHLSCNIVNCKFFCTFSYESGPCWIFCRCTVILGAHT